MSEDGAIQTPNFQTEQTTEEISSSQVEKGCLKCIEDYRKSSQKSIDKVCATHDLIDTLSSSMPELAEHKFNDSLGMYISTLEQHDQSIGYVGGDQPNEGYKAEESHLVRGKRGASPGAPEGSKKKQKQDDTDFPWVVGERLLDTQLGRSLGKMLELLKVFMRDLKFAKSSVINSSCAPPFPHSEWTNIIAGTMVNLDHVISGSFDVTHDNREVKSLGGMEVKFGVVKPVKQVKTSGDWFITWGIYSKAAVYIFPHWKDEFDTYANRILSLFAATTPFSHTAVINLNKGIRARIGECCNLLLTDHDSFEDIKLYWLNPIRVRGQTSAEGQTKAIISKKPGYCDNEPCHKWNTGECPKYASECKHKHICENCGKDH